MFASSQTMGLIQQAFSPTHGSTMLHSLVYIKNLHEPYKPIKFHLSKIHSENPKLKSNTHTQHVISLGRKRSQRSCIFDWKQANVTRWTHGWWKRELMGITRGLPTMRCLRRLRWYIWKNVLISQVINTLKLKSKQIFNESYITLLLSFSFFFLPCLVTIDNLT